MAFFNRNKTNQAGMAPEVRDYYQAEGRERTWIAWLMAFATLLVTIFVVLGLFYGGRWVFRKFKNNKSTPVAVQTESPKADENKPKDKSTSNTTQNSNEPATTPNSSSSSTTQTTPNSSSSSTPSTTTPLPTDTTTASSSNSKDLPNTGPGDIFAVFAVVSVLGYLAHRRYLGNI